MSGEYTVEVQKDHLERRMAKAHPITAVMVPALAAVIEEARTSIKTIFRNRAAEKAKAVVDEWKAKKIYPYEGEAQTQIEKAERQIFDIVAVTVQEATPDFNEAPGPQTGMRLRP